MKKYVIDGHNLIPKIRGLSLRQMDDETRLIELLGEYARVKRCAIEVFFDRAAVGYAGTKRIGAVKVSFIPRASTADEAIIRRVLNAGKLAGELTVISSDHHVANQSRAAGAQWMTADQFAQDVQFILANPPSVASSGDVSADRKLSADEVADWLKIFGLDRSKSKLE